ncbi:MAG: hypothetical protein JRH11_09205 [Deltaproteobacteria bacterium]|nr:hypothetical protein [Deltaproteobacteria bacterium]
MRITFGLLLWALAAPGVAFAQSFHLHEATVTSDGEALGQLFEAPVRITEWHSHTRPSIAYRDRVIAMRVAIDLTDPDTRLAAGVATRRAIRTASAFRIDMNAGTWAPVWGRRSDGVRIALPDGLPAREGVLPASPRMPANAAAPGEAFANRGPADGFQYACTPIRVRAQARADAELWLVEGDRFTLDIGTERGGFTRARVFRDGFVVHGWIEGGAPECQMGGIHLAGVGTGCSDGHGRGIVVTLPGGTALYATGDTRRPFGRLRAETQGIEPVYGVTAQACRDSVCRRVPPEPTGAAPWIMHNHRRGGGGWVITAWVRSPTEDLARPTNARGGFGGCRSSATSWPQPPDRPNVPEVPDAEVRGVDR